MIGQQLIMRCKKGFFDQGPIMTDGFKTAAMSQSMAVFQRRGILSEVDRGMLERSFLPDDMMVPKHELQGGAANHPRSRGILRVSAYGGGSIVGRSFCVGDLCNNRGDVNFTHNYLLTGEEQKTFLNRPEAMLNIDNFEVYQRVNQRCGGLSSGNPIVADESLSLLRNISDPVPCKILEQVGFDEEAFSSLISALCDRIVMGGQVVLLMPQVSSGDWDQYGGSLLGERVITVLMRLLPDCVRRRVGCVSYWDRELGYHGLKGIHLVVAPNTGSADFYRDSVSLINTEIHQCRNVPPKSDYGRFLWSIRWDEEKLGCLFRYINTLLGENQSKFLPKARSMDLLTKLYLYENKSMAQDASIELVTEALWVFQNQLELFPEVDKRIRNLLNQVRMSGKHTPALEGAILQVIQSASPQVLSLSSYQEMFNCLLQYMYTDQAGEQTARYLTEQVKNSNPTLVSHVVDGLAEMNSSSLAKMSARMLGLIVSIYHYRQTQTETVRRTIEQTVNKSYDLFLKNGQWQICLDILLEQAKLLTDTRLNTKQAQILYKKIIDLYIDGDQTCRDKLASCLSKEINRLPHCTLERTGALWDCFKILAERVASNPAEYHREVFGCFIQMLPVIVQRNRKDWEENWKKIYHAFLKSMGSREEILFPDQMINSVSGGKEWVILESVRIGWSVYVPDGNRIAGLLQKLSQDQRNKNGVKILIYDFRCGNKAGNLDGLMQALSGELTFYRLMLMALQMEQTKAADLLHERQGQTPADWTLLAMLDRECYQLRERMLQAAVGCPNALPLLRQAGKGMDLAVQNCLVQAYDCIWYEQNKEQLSREIGVTILPAVMDRWIDRIYVEEQAVLQSFPQKGSQSTAGRIVRLLLERLYGPRVAAAGQTVIQPSDVRNLKKDTLDVLRRWRKDYGISLLGDEEQASDRIFEKLANARDERDFEQLGLLLTEQSSQDRRAFRERLDEVIRKLERSHDLSRIDGVSFSGYAGTCLFAVALDRTPSRAMEDYLEKVHAYQKPGLEAAYLTEAFRYANVLRLSNIGSDFWDAFSKQAIKRLKCIKQETPQVLSNTDYQRMYSALPVTEATKILFQQMDEEPGDNTPKEGISGNRLLIMLLSYSIVVLLTCLLVFATSVVFARMPLLGAVLPYICLLLLVSISAKIMLD